VSGNESAGNLFRRAAFQSAEIKRLAPRDRDVLEHGVVAFPINISRIRDGNLRLVRIWFGENDNAIAVRIRERLEQDRVNHTEDRGVRADPEREGEDCDEGKAGRFPELAEREAEIVHGALRFIWP